MSYFIYGLKYQNEKKYQGQISQTWYEAGLCDPHFLSVTHRYFIDTKAKWARVNCDRSRDPNMSWYIRSAEILTWAPLNSYLSRYTSGHKSVTGFVLVVHGLERPQHVECKLRAAAAAWSSHFNVLRSFQSMHPSHSSGNYYLHPCEGSALYYINLAF